MTLSEPQKPEAWKASPILQAKSAAPAFLRLNWDDAEVAGFGPWRIINQDAPLMATSLEPAGLQDIELLPEPNAGHETEVDAPAASATAQQGMDPQALEALKMEAYAEGLAAGRTEGRKEAEQAMADERTRDRALLSNVIASVQNLAADQEQLFEPLKRLALHLAEQLVRAELQLSGAAIEQLVRQCLAHLDQPADKAVVCLNPDDLERLRRFGDAAEGLRLEADARLQPGSVRVEVNDSLVEDLIEHRLEVLSRQLLGDAHVRLQPSSLAAQRTEVEDAGRSPWPGTVSDDVTDLPYRSNDEPEPPQTPENKAGD